LYPARGTLQIAQLLFEQLQSAADTQNVFDGKNDSRKLQKVVADRLGDVERGVSELAAKAYHGGHALSRKVHEFHKFLL
jgi:hypothetical protein